MKSRIKEHCITKIAKIKNILSAPPKDVLYKNDDFLLFSNTIEM